ncbi:chemotaxis protein CheW [Mangrovihabitans endophyticus]|uniref:CheW-like domain-containing protein n=1 Tax=Mangrovihabitans endophyticus TaxID=1751298 RepID=A0A8J3BY51_9ACTN|nr:chemotaxis protein CheW [Mangrovihabitans endophyticus]GGK83117.1 hypothetical protein GCM10012284_16570 [Mangrovihabitans endophyticus]
MTTGTAYALYGVFRVGAMRVALPLDELREVIMKPEQFSSLPATADGLLGAVNLRHVVIPVLDLCRLAGSPCPDDGSVIVIVAQDGRVFGLLADEIEGVTRVTPEALLKTDVAGDQAALFSHTFERAEDREVISLLDAQAIAGRPGVPAVCDVGLRPPTMFAGDGDRSRRTVLLLRCGSIRLCIDVRHVHSVIPQLTVLPSPLEGQICQGVVHLHGRAVPVVDPLRLLGLGAQSDEAQLQGMVLATERGLVACSVSDIADIITVPAGDMLPLPPIRVGRVGLLTGVLTTEDGDQVLVLDGEALRADAELDTLASLGLPLDNRDAEPAKPSRAEAAAEGPEGRHVVTSVRTFLTYSVGMEAATPLDQIAEILPYPPHVTHLTGGGALIGIFTHRRLSVPLMSLPALLNLGDATDPATARVLLVDTPGGELMGFAVPTLHAIEESVWEEAGPKDKGEPGTALQRGPLVKIGDDGHGRLLPHVDLKELVAAELAA